MLSTSPEREHLAVAHPAQSPSTTSFIVFSFCRDQQKLNIHLGLPLRYRAIRLTGCTSHRRVRGVSHHLFRFDCSIVPHHSYTAPMHLTRGGLGGCTCQIVYLQLLLLLSMLPCRVVSLLPLPGPCQTCPAQSRSSSSSSLQKMSPEIVRLREYPSPSESSNHEVMCVGFTKNHSLNCDSTCSTMLTSPTIKKSSPCSS